MKRQDLFSLLDRHFCTWINRTIYSRFEQPTVFVETQRLTDDPNIDMAFFTSCAMIHISKNDRC